jgi:hypothetical protein
MVDVGLYHGGVDAELAASQQLVGGELAQQRVVELLDRLGPARPTSSGQGGRVRDGLVQADVAKPPPGDRVGDLAAQALVAELVAVLEVQQPQQGLDWERGAAQPSGKQCPPGGDEAFVVE